MYARIVSVQVPPEKVDELIDIWHNTIEPLNRQQPGRQSAQLLLNRETGKAAFFSLWETEEAMDATGLGSSVAQAQQASLAGLLLSPPTVERFEAVD